MMIRTGNTVAPAIDHPEVAAPLPGQCRGGCTGRARLHVDAAGKGAGA
jgi:hypothetical protein